VVAAEKHHSFASFQTTEKSHQSPNEKLNANVDRLITLTERVSRLKLSTNSTPEQTQKVIDSVEDIIRRLDFIRQDIGAKKLKLSEEAVDQLNGFAQVLVSILSSLDHTDPTLNAVQQKRIEAIETDLDFRMSRISEIRGTSTEPVTYPGVRVVVRTLRPDGSPETSLRIYYLGDVYFESEYAKENLKTFDRLSSPSDREIPEGYYRIWAGRGTDPTAVSDVKALQAIKPSSGLEITVDLLIIK
jgi:hypothetical protein